MAQKGTLTVVLIGADTQKPMQGVAVIRTCGGTSEGKTTDAQGKAVFAIETPDKIASQTPRSSQKPYCSVDLKIVANGYLTLTIVGEQVFADTSTLQRLEMIPYDGSKFEKVIITPPHKLYASQSSAKAPTGAVSAFSELKQPRPTVPETITVHLGAPGREAEDVTVPFIYYVKNVASSEIYPTWPTESLKANILCIVSLALNRIYTEWYRSQGYEYGLTVTGNVPKETWDAIVETHYALGGEGGDDKIKKYPGSSVRRGNSGENVLYIQRALNAIRNNVPSIRRLDEDGVFGSETLGAVKEFQSFYDLNADGVVGPLTWEAINLEYQRSD